MINTTLLEFNKNNRKFQSLKDMSLVAIPSKDDKVVIDIDGIGYVFKVYDVHYGIEGRIDINVIRIANVTDYNLSKFPDIK